LTHSHFDGKILLRNAHCINFTKKKAELCSLLIVDGKIEARLMPHVSLAKDILEKDLQGHYVIPGFTDGHTHLISTGIEMQRLDLSHCRSLDECLELVSAQARTRALVFASNWDENSWRHDEGTRLSRQVLDKISKTKPLIMRRICGHYAVVNTMALQRIPKHWKIIDRKNGYLYEDVALNLNDIFVPTDEMLEKGLALATNRALRIGITSVHEIINARRFAMLQKHRSALKLRFAIYLTEKYFDHVIAVGLRTGCGDEWLRFAGVKIYLDGSVGARTAALYRPYADTKGRGNILIPLPRLHDTVRSAEENGLQLMIHSIGDRATARVLSVLEKYLKSNNPLRHRIEHLEILRDASVANIARQKIIASMQPNFLHWQHPGGMYEKVLGSRYLKMNCFKSLLERHVKVVFGSDCMPMGPLDGLHSAITHPVSSERLDVATAFRLYTETGAYATFEEKIKGRVEPGYFADLVILDKNPLEEKNLRNLKIESVMVGGRFVYKSAAAN
jgi:predicted amidohydrolase YtcJ